MKKLYSFSELESWNTPIMENFIHANIYSQLESRTYCVVDLDKVEEDSGGVIESTELHIFPSYGKALDMLNHYEYINDYAIDVYEWDNDADHHITTAYMMYKVFDGFNYSRYAQPKIEPIPISFWREMFDQRADIYLHNVD